jgi:hypothetical protein
MLLIWRKMDKGVSEERLRETFGVVPLAPGCCNLSRGWQKKLKSGVHAKMTGVIGRDASALERRVESFRTSIIQPQQNRNHGVGRREERRCRS